MPINNSPSIMTYSYYGYMNAILSADYSGEGTVADIEMLQFNKEDWNEVSEKLTYEIKDNHLLFYANSYYDGMNACLYRPLLENDAIDITIHSQLYSQPWGAINVFISDLSEGDIMEDDQYLFRMGRFNKEGIYTRINNVYEKYLQIDYALPVSMSIIREGECVAFRVKTKHGDWQEIKIAKLDKQDEKPLNIGFQVKLNDSAYINWKYSNFIQVCSEITSPALKIEYFFGLKKNWKCYINNYFINFRLIKMLELETWNINKLDFVKKSIDCDKYVEMWINYFFIKSRSEYMEIDHFHEYLIYGYSDSSKLLYILGYNNDGRLVEDVISYEDFLNERNRCYSQDYLVEYEKELDGYTYNFDKESVVEILKQYLDSTNSTIYTNHIFPKMVMRYGIEIYDGIMTDEGLRSLLYDRRIAHLIYEHKKCMRERLVFLRSRGVPIKESLIEQCDELLTNALRLRNVCRKYFLVEKTKEKYADLRKRVENIKMLDQAFI